MPEDEVDIRDMSQTRRYQKSFCFALHSSRHVLCYLIPIRIFPAFNFPSLSCFTLWINALFVWFRLFFPSPITLLTCHFRVDFIHKRVIKPSRSRPTVQCKPNAFFFRERTRRFAREPVMLPVHAWWILRTLIAARWPWRVETLGIIVLTFQTQIDRNDM